MIGLSKRKTGLQGENLAAAYLESIGYKILVRNYRNRFGEIDIIALDKGVLVFVEVKFRNNRRFGLPEDAVNKKKIEKIKKVGYLFWRTEFPDISKLRVDVVSILREDSSLSVKITKNVY